MSPEASKENPPPGPGCFDRTKCPVCGAAPATHLASPTPWHLAWCDECSFGFITNPPRYEALTAEFEWEESLGTERKRRHESHGTVGGRVARSGAWVKRCYHRITKRDKLLSLTTANRFNGRIIDVGCGDGILWDSLPRNCAPIGIELSPALAAQARERLAGRDGQLVEADGLAGLQQLADNSADGAILISYIEHEADPVSVLRELSRVLRAGSRLILKLPNYACWNRVVRRARWCGFRFPQHVNYFTPRSLRRIVERNGFKVVRFNWSDRLPTSDNMWIVAHATC